MKTKKILLLALCLVMLTSIFLASCSDDKTATATSTAAVTSTPKELPQIELSMTVYGPRTGPNYANIYVPIAWWMDYLSGGKIKLVGYAEGEKVKGTDILDAVGSGVIDMGIAVPTSFGAALKEAEFEAGMPFMLDDGYDLLNFWHSPKVEGILREVYAERNIRYIASGTSLVGAPGIFMTNFPVATVADFKGKKIGAMGTVAKMVDALGATAVTVTTTDMYLALDRGTVDGVVAHPSTLAFLKFNEVVDYYMTPAVTYYNNAVFMNMDKWNSLPKEYQAIVNAATAAGAVMGGPITGLSVQQGYDAAKAKGVKSIVLSDAVMKEIRSKAVPLWDEVGKASPRAARLVEALKEFLKAKGKL